MLNHPHIASQLARQRQREMVAQASQGRLRRQLRAQARPCARTMLPGGTGLAAAGPGGLRARSQRPACRRPI
jgi:hypothetical protein